MRPFLVFSRICTVALLLLTGCASQVQQRSHTDLLRIEPGDRVAQTVAPTQGVVTGADVLLATYGSDVEGTLTLWLTAADGQVLGQAEVDGADLADNGWSGAPLDRPVPPGAATTLTVAWSGSGPIGVYANVPSPEVRQEDVAAGRRLLNDPYPGGELQRDDAPAPGDLAFRLRGTDAGWWKVEAAVRRIGSGLRATPVFTLLWVLSLAAAAALAWGGLHPRGRKGERPPPAAEQLGEGRPHEQQGERQEAGAQQPR